MFFVHHLFAWLYFFIEKQRKALTLHHIVWHVCYKFNDDVHLIKIHSNTWEIQVMATFSYLLHLQDFPSCISK